MTWPPDIFIKLDKPRPKLAVDLKDCGRLINFRVMKRLERFTFLARALSKICSIRLAALLTGVSLPNENQHENLVSSGYPCNSFTGYASLGVIADP
ncbi:MAG: hypothetical protein ACWGNO_08040, partial [Desulfobacterales bacterium]